MKLPIRGAKRSSIWDQSILSFGMELARFLPGRKIDAFQTHREDDLKAVNQVNRKVSPPFFTYRIEGMQLDRNRWNPGAMRRHGIVTQKRSRPQPGVRDLDPQIGRNVLHIQPCLTTIQVSFVSSAAEAQLFSQLWLEAALGNYFFYILQFQDYPIGIKAELSDDITFPAIGESEQTELVVSRTSAILHNYHGSEMEVRTIRRYTVQGTVVGRHEEPDGSRRAHDAFAIEYKDEEVDVDIEEGE